jgi:Fe-S oxidoreductase
LAREARLAPEGPALPDYAAWASRFAPLLNLRNRSGLLARLGERWLGFSARRSLPQWQSRHFFNTKHAGASRDELLEAQRPVVLFVDTFNGYFEPANARAALRVLQAAGYTVHVAARTWPAGRSRQPRPRPASCSMRSRRWPCSASRSSAWSPLAC